MRKPRGFFSRGPSPERSGPHRRKQAVRAPVPDRTGRRGAGQHQTPEPPPATPPKARRSISGALRLVAGAREELLAKVPNERARYTALGALLVSTALIATASMWLALRQVTDAGMPIPMMLAGALVWGGFILAVDRSLILVSGTDKRRRTRLFVVRLVLSAMLGFVVAEPLVVQTFDTAIQTHLRDERDRKADQLQAALLRCNPDPGAPGNQEGPADCAEYRLTFSSAAAAGADELVNLRAQAESLEKTVADDTAAKKDLDEAARRECAGEAGEGLTGSRGFGPLCRQAHQVAVDFAETHQIDVAIKKLAELKEQIRGLEKAATAAQKSFQTDRAQLVQQRVEKWKEDNPPIFGLLERFGALDELTRASGGLWLREWFVRLFLVLIDCLPVLVKFLGGVTTYDVMCKRENDSSNSVHIKEIKAGQDLQFARIEAQLREGVAGIKAALYRFRRELSLQKDIEAMQRSARMIGALDEQEPPRPDPSTPDASTPDPTGPVPPRQRSRAGKSRVKPGQPATGADDQTG
jgi:Domain of unknown function (DUF4407)